MINVAFILFLFIFGIRLLRWVSIVQQKEYRLDRLIAFLKTRNGFQEVVRILPNRSDFSRTGLKRPRVTLRALLVFCMSLILLCFLLLEISVMLTLVPSSIKTVVVVIAWVGLILIVPVIVAISVVPTALMVNLRIYIELQRAKTVFDKTKPTIIGITGSYGKTSTKLLLAHILSQKYTVFSTPGSHNTRFSVARAIRQGLKNQQMAVLEYAAYTKGEIAELVKWFPPDSAIITGLAPQHLELFGSLDAIIQAKSELVKAVPDDGPIFYYAGNKGAERIVTRGKRPTHNIHSFDLSDLPITNPAMYKNGTLSFKWNNNKITTTLVGGHYQEALVISWRVARHFGLTDEHIVRGIRSFQAPEKFIRSYQLSTSAQVIDDGGTSNTTGFEAVIDLADSLPYQRKTLITPGIVDLGDESEVIHNKLAKRSCKIFDTICYVGSEGEPQFIQQCSNKVVTAQNEVTRHISNLQMNDLLVIEGRIPGWAVEQLRKLQKS